MSKTGPREVRRIFGRALELAPERRAAFVERECAGEPELMREVLALLEARDGAGDFLESGPSGPVLADALRDYATDPLVGRSVGSYRIIDVIARGGMGIVYRAEQDDPRREVALKFIAPGLCAPEYEKRFKAEAELLGRLKHPGIAQVYEAGSVDAGSGPQLYFAMELVEGLPLREYVEQQQLGTEARVELMLRICGAIQHAHQRGVIHRDLKPANILVGNAGRPKVLDFGIARATDADVQANTVLTSPGALMGTLPYMSPEQVQGDASEIDTRSDVYALGVVLYELLSESLPHEFGNVPWTEAIRIVVEDSPKPLERVGTRFPPDLSTIVYKALAKDRELRYGSPAELAADLRRFLEKQPIAARPPSMLYLLRKLVARNRLASGFALTLLLALVAAGAALLVQNQSIRAERDRANLEAETAREVSEFLEGLFRVSDPSEGQGDEVTAREMLDRGAQRIQNELDARPLVQARLMGTMGRVYANLGLASEAIPLLERAIERSQSRSERVPLLVSLAWAQRQAGHLDTAIDTARQAMTTATEEGSAADNELATALTSLGTFLRDSREYAQARRVLTRALEIREGLLGPDHEDVGVTLYHIGWLQYLQKESETALKTYERACAILKREVGAEHARTAWCLNDKAVVLASLGDRDAAERHHQQALAIRRKILPPGHPDLIGSAKNLAYLHWDAAEFAGAKEAYLDVLRMTRDGLGPEHPEVVGALQNVAFAYERLGEWESAEGYLRQAVELAGRLFGEDHPEYAAILSSLGGHHARRGQTPEAESAFRDALRIVAGTAGRSSSQFTSLLYSLASLLWSDFARFEEVAEILEDYVTRSEAEEKPRIAAVGRAKTQLGRVLWFLGRQQDACKHLSEAFPLVTESLGQDHRFVADAAYWLGTCRAAAGKADEAAALYEQTLRIRRAIDGDSAGLHFIEATIAAQRSDRQAVTRFLQAALDGGFRHRLAPHYPHFAEAIQDPEVSELLHEVAGPS